MTIQIPIYEFFTNSMAVESEETKKCRAGNPYSGSLGTDPGTGFMNRTDFGYRILLKKAADGTKSFIASCWTCPPYKAGQPARTENHEERVFEGGKESLPLIEEWLTEKYRELIDKA